VYSVGGDIGEYNTDGNTVLVTGSGSVWSNSGDLLLGGEDSSGDSLIVADGGKVYNNNFLFGYDGNSAIVVTGSGSEWDVQELQLTMEGGGNTLVITNGGVVNSSSCLIGNSGPLLVTGKDSVWNSGSIEFTGGDEVSFTICDGGTVYSAGVYFQNDFPPEILVTGTGSVWQTSLDADEDAAGFSMIVSDGATVFGSGAENLGFSGTTISGGSLYITNGLNIGESGLTLNSGTLNVDSFSSTTTQPSHDNPIDFNGGTLITGATTISNGLEFIVGDGTDAATFQLASGGSGIHSFANGLTISSNAFLTGCGTIEGSVVVNPGGTVLANCGGTLTFTGIVTNNGTMQAINGSVLEGYGLVVNNGIIDIRAGTTNFLGGFINNGIVITTSNFPAVTAIQVVGSDVEIGVKTGNGSTYVFEETTNLTSGCWMPVIEFNGTGNVITFVDPGAATLPQRFYRVGLIPSP
jgi:fibronectin-binding autotransporter adhesin